MRSFPDYQYRQLPAIREVFKAHDALSANEFKPGNSFHQNESGPSIVFKSKDEVDMNPKDSPTGHCHDYYSHTKVFDMLQFSTLFWGSHCKGRWTRKDEMLKGVNEKLVFIDSIGLGDLLEFKGTEDVVAAYFVLLFLNLVFPDSKGIKEGYEVL